MAVTAFRGAALRRPAGEALAGAVPLSGTPGGRRCIGAVPGGRERHRSRGRGPRGSDVRGRCPPQSGPFSGGRTGPGAFLRGRSPGGGERKREREQAHLAAAEQGQRVHVLTPAHQAPVQARPGAAVPGPGGQRAQHPARCDGLALRHRRPNRQVGGAQPPVDDRDHAGSRDLAREADPSRPGRQDLRTLLGGQVGTAVAGQPRPRGRVEGAQHIEGAVDGRAPGPGVGGGGRGRKDQGRRREGGGEHHPGRPDRRPDRRPDECSGRLCGPRSPGPCGEQGPDLRRRGAA